MGLRRFSSISPVEVLVDVGRGVLGGFRRDGLPRFAFLEDLEVVGDPLLVGLGDADHVSGDDDRQLPGELGPEVDLLRVTLERGVEQAFHLRLDHGGEFFADRLGGEPALEEPAPPGLIGWVALEDVGAAEQRGVVDVDALGAGVGLPVARDGPDVVVAGDRVEPVLLAVVERLLVAQPAVLLVGVLGGTRHERVVLAGGFCACVCHEGEARGARRTDCRRAPSGSLCGGLAPEPEFEFVPHFQSTRQILDRLVELQHFEEFVAGFGRRNQRSFEFFGRQALFLRFLAWWPVRSSSVPELPLLAMKRACQAGVERRS